MSRTQKFIRKFVAVNKCSMCGRLFKFCREFCPQCNSDIYSHKTICYKIPIKKKTAKSELKITLKIYDQQLTLFPGGQK